MKTVQDAVLLTHASHSNCSLECHDEIQSGMRKLFFVSLKSWWLNNNNNNGIYIALIYLLWVSETTDHRGECHALTIVINLGLGLSL